MTITIQSEGRRNTFPFKDEIRSAGDQWLLEWDAQYGGMQAGYYPGLRRARSRVLREIIKRGLRSHPHTTADGLASFQLRGICPLSSGGYWIDPNGDGRPVHPLSPHFRAC